MKISVAMCTYDGARLLREQLDSLVQQTRRPDELVVCDDQSRDDTERLLREFAAEAPFDVRVHRNEERLGSTRNFERAIGLCSGDVIALCDQDDAWHSEKLRRIEREFEADPVLALAFSDLDVAGEDLRPLGYRAWQCTWLELDDHGLELFRSGRGIEVLITRNVVVGCSLAFRAKFRNLVLPIPTQPTFIHDYWIAAVLACVGSVACIDEPLVIYRSHGNQQLGLLPPPPSRSRAASVWRRLSLYRFREPLFQELHKRFDQAGIDARERALASARLGRLAHARRRASLVGQGYVNRALTVTAEILRSGYAQGTNPDAGGFFELAFDIADTLIPYGLRRRA